MYLQISRYPKFIYKYIENLQFSEHISGFFLHTKLSLEALVGWFSWCRPTFLPVELNSNMRTTFVAVIFPAYAMKK